MSSKSDQQEWIDMMNRKVDAGQMNPKAKATDTWVLQNAIKDNVTLKHSRAVFGWLMPELILFGISLLSIIFYESLFWQWLAVVTAFLSIVTVLRAGYLHHKGMQEVYGKYGVYLAGRYGDEGDGLHNQNSQG